MNKFVIAIFPSESKAYEGKRALLQLDSEGSITLYATAVVAKESNGGLSIKDTADSGPLGMAVGALVGGTVGLLGGPIGAVLGMEAGALIGSLGDLVNLGVQTDYVEAVRSKLAPGKVALVAEIDEDWVTPLDTRIEALGGEIIREPRFDFEDARIEASIREREAELARLQEEWSRASEDRKAKLKAQIGAAQARLNAAVKSAQELVRKLDQEAAAKIKKLEAQAAKANGDAKARIEQRIAKTRADYQRRTALLRQAWELAKQALAA